jgi:hypothetical protein
MKNKYVTSLKLPFEIDTSGVDKVMAGYKNVEQYMIFPYPKADVDKKLIEFIDSFGLFISHEEMFYTPPGSKLPIHVDQHVFSNMSKLNWVFGEGENVWWEPKPKIPLNYHTTPIGTQYLHFKEEDVIEVHRSSVGKSTFFNAGVAHSVDNTKSAVGRWTLCHCISYKSTRKNIQMDEVHEIFRDYITE